MGIKNGAIEAAEVFKSSLARQNRIGSIAIYWDIHSNCPILICGTGVMVKSRSLLTYSQSDRVLGEAVKLRDPMSICSTM